MFTITEARQLGWKHLTRLDWNCKWLTLTAQGRAVLREPGKSLRGTRVVTKDYPHHGWILMDSREVLDAIAVVKSDWDYEQSRNSVLKDQKGEGS